MTPSDPRLDQPDSRLLVPPALWALLLGAGVFTWLSSRRLPEVVASHFDAAGRSNGDMPRGPYIAIMVLITLAVPLFIVVVANLALSAPNARINLPNRDYWLAPERRAETVRYISSQTATLAAGIVLFMCYVQWLLVRANAITPPALDSRAMSVGLAVFLVYTAFWGVRLVRRFRREA